jgi:hypothetical protein
MQPMGEPRRVLVAFEGEDATGALATEEAAPLSC